MAEENQAQQGPAGPAVPAESKEPQQVTTKDPKKVEVGKRLAAINRKKREEQAKLEKTASRVNQYCRVGAILALGVIGGLGYYIYWSKKGEVQNNPPKQSRPQAIATQPQTNKFEMD